MTDLWRRIGTPDAITWVTVVAYFPVSLVSTLFAWGGPRHTNIWLLLLASALASTAALSWLGVARILIFGRDGTLRRKTRDTSAAFDSAGSAVPARSLQVALSFAVAIVVRAVVIDWLLLEFGVSDASHIGYRITSSIPSTGACLVAVAIIVSLSRDYGRNLAELRRTQREFGELALSHTRLIEAERRRVVEFARTDLEDRLRDLRYSAAPEALGRVRAAIEELVRPLSRRLSEADPTVLAPPNIEVSRPGWQAVRRGLFSENPFRPIWFTTWMTLSSIFAAPQLWGLSGGLVFTLATAVVTFTSCSAGALAWEAFMHRLPWLWQVLLFSLVAFGGGVVIALLGWLASPAIAAEGPVLAPILGTLSVLGGWVLAALFSLQRQSSALAEQQRRTERQLHRERIRLHSLYRAEMRSLARVLHGAVQDALSIAAFRIRAAIDDEQSPERFAELLADVERSVRVAAAGIETVDRQAANAESVLGQIAELWEELARVDWRLTPAARVALAAHTATRLSFNELVREACANAVRHGEASHIDIDVDEAEGELVLTVKNLGRPLRDEVSPGLGTRLLDELTLAWQREPSTDGTVLTARLLLVD